MNNYHSRVGIILITVFLLMTSISNAQTWQGIVNYNGYQCHSLGSLVSYSVLAARTTDSGGTEFLNVKFKIPYRWKDTGTANVRITQVFLNTGQEYSQDTYMHYKDGWVYNGQYLLCGNRPCETHIITVYKDNDFGNSRGESRTYNLHLNLLNITAMPLNKEMTIYW